MIGRTIGHHEILEKLGEGGMGVVWKARDTRLDRLVALKVLPADKVSDPERKRRFVQEAKAASALNHPHIVTVYEIASEDGVDFIAMEYIRGKTLEQLIPRRGMPFAEMLRYSVQIADALAKAHGAGIVHRDLKPGNIMVNEDGLVKVLDFGLAKLTETEDSGPEGATQTIHARTEDGVIVGTSCYMSPEQAAGKNVDPRSDIFALGSLLYEMASGQRAFRGDSRMSTLAAILNQEPRPLHQIRPDVPAELEKLIGRCLRKDRERRLQHVADLKVELLDLKEDSDSGAVASVAPVNQKEGKRWLWPAVAGGAAALAMAGWFGVGRDTSKDSSLMTVKPLTSYAGLAGEATFSPDGNQVAFSWNGDKQDNFDIYVKLVDSGAPLRLTTNPATDEWPGWSPDGRQIAFLRGSGGQARELMLISPLGGVERKLADLRNEQVESISRIATPAWTPDSKFVAVRDERAIVLVSTESGEKRKLTAPPADSFGDSFCAISPDGKTLAFVRSNTRPAADIFLMALSNADSKGEKVHQLTNDNRSIVGLAWTADGKELVFSSRRSGDIMLWRVPASGGTPEPIPGAGTEVWEIATSRQGRRGAYTHYNQRSSFWRLDTSPEGVRSPAVRAVFSSRQDNNPVISPDGQRIAFRSDRSGAEELWVCDRQGANAVQLTTMGYARNPCWSPDGRKITFVSRVKERTIIFVIDAGGGTPHPIVQQDGNGPTSWSRDGRWIYFWRRNPNEQVWKVPAAGGNPVQLTKGGGRQGMESWDGRFFFYRKGEDLWKVPVNGGEETLVSRERMNVMNYWTLGREGLYFSQADAVARKTLLRLLNLDTHQVSHVAVLDQPYPNQSMRLSLSADGRSLLYDQVDRNESDLMLIENFH